LAGGLNGYVYPVNPAEGVDPLGLDAAAGVYLCKRPVDGKPGDKLNIFMNHHYLCAVERDGDGVFPCYGLTTANPDEANDVKPGKPYKGIIAGQDRGDYYDSSCEMLGRVDDKEGPKLLKEIAKRPPPTFGIGPFLTDCQEWAEEANEELHRKAGNAALCSKYPNKSVCGED
jgi:hypothetical protein